MDCLTASPSIKRIAGLLLAILCAINFSLIAVITKVSQNFHPLTQATWKFAVLTLLAILLCAKHYWSCSVSQFKICKKTMLLIQIRAFCGWSAVITYFYSLTYLDIGDTMVIQNAAPALVFVLSFLFFKEKFGVFSIMTLIISFVGVIIITKPPLLSGETFDKNHVIGAVLALLDALAVAGAIITMRSLKQVYHGLTTLVLGIWGVVLTGVLAFGMGVMDYPHDWKDAILLTVSGVFAFLAQTCQNTALQLEQAGPVSLAKTSEIVFVFLWQVLFLDTLPETYTIVGACLVTTGTVLTIIKKWRELPNISPRSDKHIKDENV